MESNLRDAINYLVELGESNAEPKTIEINGKLYCNKNLKRYDEKPRAKVIEASTLTSLIDYIHQNREEMDIHEKMILHVINPTFVQLYSVLDKERNREYLFECNARIPKFEFERELSQEQFIIGLQACFVQNEDVEMLLKVAGNVENKTVANYGDDGVSQKATIKQGIASKVDVVVPNPVALIPYRSFLEIKQPESKFVFRISEGRGGEPLFKLINADAGAWKAEAMHRIQMYLADALRDVIDDGRIILIA